MGGGDLHIKTMLEWSLPQKHKKVIKHEIMVHHGFSRPISFKSIYTMKEWKEVECANDYNDKLFKVLERQLTKKNFINKLKLNPSKDPPPLSFVDTLRRWKPSKNHKGVLANALVVKNSYRC
jgi:hypothetical protein